MGVTSLREGLLQVIVECLNQSTLSVSLNPQEAFVICHIFSERYDQELSYGRYWGCLGLTTYGVIYFLKGITKSLSLWSVLEVSVLMPKHCIVTPLRLFQNGKIFLNSLALNLNWTASKEFVS